MDWFIRYRKSDGVDVVQTQRPIVEDATFGVYQVPAEFVDPRTGQTTWQKTHVWDPVTRSLIPAPAPTKSQSELDWENFQTNGIQNQADLYRFAQLLAMTIPSSVFRNK